MDPKKTSLQDALAPLTEEAPATRPIPPSSGPLKSLRTYQGDVEEIIGKKNTSVVSIAVAEQKRKIERHEPTTPPEESGEGFFTELKNKSFVAAGIWLIVFGVIIVGVGYGIKILIAKPISSVPTKIALIHFTKEVDISAASSTRSSVVHSILANNATFAMPANSVLYLNMMGLSSQDVIQLLAPNAPSLLVRSLDASYMVGIYASDTNEPFIILKTTDYNQSFAGMLQWEDTMVSDVSDVFSIPQNTATSTYKWSDEAIDNKDLRVVSGPDKKTVLLYSFLDKNTIVITANESIFTAIVGKFVNSQMVR